MTIFGYKLDKVFSVVKDAFAVVTALESLDNSSSNNKKVGNNGSDIK